MDNENNFYRKSGKPGRPLYNIDKEIQTYEIMKKYPKLSNYVVKSYQNPESGILLENLKTKGYILLSDFQKELNRENEYIYPLIVKNLIDGLNLLHKYGIYHLDIKGNNIFIKKYTGEIKYIDFGNSIIDENLMVNQYKNINNNDSNFSSNSKQEINNYQKVNSNINKVGLRIDIPKIKKKNEYMPSLTIYYILKKYIKNLTKENLKLLDKVALGLVLFNIFPKEMKSNIPFVFYENYNNYIDFINTKLDEVNDIIYPLNNSLKQYLKTNPIFLTLNIIQEKNKETIN